MKHDTPDLPCLMNVAVEKFLNSPLIEKYLSAEFQLLYGKTKEQELNEFQRRVTDFEIESYLRG
jgi:glutamine synthetase